jgi:hypothetical protein
MRKAVSIIGVITGIAVALGIDGGILTGRLSIEAAACVAFAIAMIVIAKQSSNYKTPLGGDLAYIRAASASRAAENGETYVITGKSIHNNQG